jgi:hypothetical protein
MTPPQITEDRPRKRKNFRIPADLADWAEQYAANKNTTMTQLIIDFLTDMHDKDQKS